MFGGAALSDMQTPAITLMSTIKITGGFLKRADAFMFGIWFFTLYALLNSAVFYAEMLLNGLYHAKKRQALWKKWERAAVFAAVFGVAVLLNGRRPFPSGRTGIRCTRTFLCTLYRCRRRRFCRGSESSSQPYSNSTVLPF